MDGIDQHGNIFAVGEAAWVVGKDADQFMRLGRVRIAIVSPIFRPRKEASVSGRLDELFLESVESVAALAVKEGHVNAEETEKAVGSVLDPCCFSPGSPRHALSS